MLLEPVFSWVCPSGSELGGVGGAKMIASLWLTWPTILSAVCALRECGMGPLFVAASSCNHVVTVHHHVVVVVVAVTWQ
jgi:hypothetical protein